MLRMICTAFNTALKKTVHDITGVGEDRSSHAGASSTKTLCNY